MLAAIGITVQNIEFWCGGASQIGAGFNGKNLIEINAGAGLGNSLIENVQLLGCGAATTGLTGLLAQSASGITGISVRVDGFGAASCKFNASSGTYIEWSNGYCANGATQPFNVTGAGKFFFDDNIIGSTLSSAPAASAVYSISVGGVAYSHHNAYDYTTGTGTAQVQAIGEVHFTDDTVTNPTGGVNFGLVGGNGATASQIYLNGVHFKVPGTGNCIIGNAGGVSFFDLGGNHFVPSVDCPATAFSANGSTLFGSLSITGTALAAANLTPTTNFGTGCATAGQCMSAVSGSSGRGQFTVTYGTGPASPQTLTATFPTVFLVAPFCTLTDVGGTNAFPTSVTTTSTSTTSAVFSIVNTPVAGNTDIFQLSCGTP